MNREIRFRGHSILSTQWICGDLRIVKKTAGDIRGGSYIVNSFGHSYEVKPETVSQYVEFNDKNGTYIYENQTVRFTAFGRVVCGKVEWDTDDGLPGFVIVDTDGSGTIWNFMYDDLEVIGNIFENQESVDEKPVIR